MDTNELFLCRVCGLQQSDPPWGEDGNSPTFNYCPCCGVEFGYGDATEKAIQQWRSKWLEKGANWSEVELRPKNWSLEEQISKIPKRSRG